MRVIQENPGLLATAMQAHKDFELGLLSLNELQQSSCLLAEMIGTVKLEWDMHCRMVQSDYLTGKIGELAVNLLTQMYGKR